MHSKWLTALSLSILSACVTLLPACGQRDPAVTNQHDTGTLTLGLATTSQGRNYRLRQASFDVSGPTHAVLDGEQDPDAPALTTELDPGSYQVALNGSWFLERLDASGPVRLTASLISDNPLPVEVGSGATSSVVFRFGTDGTTVALGAGRLSIATEVVDTSASSLPPGLNVLAGQPGGWGYADGVGAQVRFQFGALSTVTTDGAGSLFVSDWNSIRKVALASGEVTTVATSSSLADNEGTLCATGMVVVAEALYFGNCDATIRQIALATGQITLVAGSPGQSGNVDGTGSAARFGAPSGLVTDGQGNLYVSDSSKRVIRKLVLATAEVTTFAGAPDESGTTDGLGTAARFAAPNSLTFNGDGNLYVADLGAVRQVALASGQVSTLAGGTTVFEGIADGTGSAARFDAVEHITSDDVGNLYVSDFSTLRKISLATSEVTTLAGAAGEYGYADGAGAEARFYESRGIVHVDGLLYVVDLNNDAIRRVSLDSNIVSTLAGAPRRFGNQDGASPAATFGYSGAAVSDGQGNLYVADPDMHTIRKIVVASGLTSTLAGQPRESGHADGIGNAARMIFPWGITRDGRGNLYITDMADYTVRKIVPNTGEVSTLAGKSGIAGTSNGVGTDATLDRPRCITSDGADTLYVTDSFSEHIRKIDIHSRRVTTVAISGLPQIMGLASDRAGVLYFSDGEGSIQKLVLDQGVILPVAGSDQLGFADGVGSAALFQSTLDLALDGAGHLYVIDGGNLIRKLELSTGTVTTVVGVPNIFRGVLPGPLPGRLNLAAGLAVLPGGLAILDESAVLTAGF
jgi:sugar lactone lactonase YvrE